MKEIIERVIELGFEKDPEKLVTRIEEVALEMRAQKFYFVKSQVDRSFERMTLFFEREF